MMRSSVLLIIFILGLCIEKAYLIDNVTIGRTFELSIQGRDLKYRSYKFFTSIFLRATVPPNADYHRTSNLFEETSDSFARFNDLYLLHLGVGTVLSPLYILSSIGVLSEMLKFVGLDWIRRRLHVAGGLDHRLDRIWDLNDQYRKAEKIFLHPDSNLDNENDGLNTLIIIELKQKFEFNAVTGIDKICFQPSVDQSEAFATLVYGENWKPTQANPIRRHDVYKLITIFGENYFEQRGALPIQIQVKPIDSEKSVCQPKQNVFCARNVPKHCPVDMGAPLLSLKKTGEILSQLGVLTYVGSDSGKLCDKSYLNRFTLTHDSVLRWIETIVGNELCILPSPVKIITTETQETAKSTRTRRTTITKKPDLKMSTKKITKRTFAVETGGATESTNEDLRITKKRRQVEHMKTSIVLMVVIVVILGAAIILLLMRSRKKNKKAIRFFNKMLPVKKVKQIKTPKGTTTITTVTRE